MYRASPRRRAVLYGIWALLTLPLAIGGLVARDPALLFVALIVTAIVLPIFVWALRSVKLTLTPDGIELRHAGGTLETTWENVEAMHLAPGGEGFILREPIQGRAAARYATASQLVVQGAPLYEPYRRNLLAERRFIPIEPFGYWLAHGDLRHTIERFVPGLVARAESSAAAQGQHRRRLDHGRSGKFPS